jgi:Family of unknown function (DUF6502)
MSGANVPDDDSNAAPRAALARLLEPLARLALARGVPFATLDGLLREAMVRHAHAAHPNLPEHRRTSRVSAATGLNRREVDRLLAKQGARAAAAGAASSSAAPRRTPAAMVFAHWRASPAYRTKAGAPRVLPRTGPAPSFESLAHEVTRDMHPRALLEELLRLRLATHDATRDTVALARADFVPSADPARMLGWLAANVGDHLDGAVANVSASEPRHADQAIAAEGLSAESLARVRPLLLAHWQRMNDEIVPLLEDLIDADARAASPARPNEHRVRIGLYTFDTVPAVAPAPQPEPAPTAALPARRKTRKIRP